MRFGVDCRFGVDLEARICGRVLRTSQKIQKIKTINHHYKIVTSIRTPLDRRPIGVPLDGNRNGDCLIPSWLMVFPRPNEDTPRGEFRTNNKCREKR